MARVLGIALTLAGCEASPAGPESSSTDLELARRPAEPSARIEQLPMLVEWLDARASAITEGGIVVGSATVSVSPSVVSHAVRWQRATGSGDWQPADLQDFLPANGSSGPTAISETGIVIGWMEIGGVLHGFALPVEGDGIDLGAGAFANAVSPLGELAGVRECGTGSACLRVPQYWAEPGADSQQLPTLEPGTAGEALFFRPGGGVVGTASDASGQWLVEWTRSGGAWSVSRLRFSPPGGPLPREVSAAGPAFGNGCPQPEFCDPLYDLRPFAWTALAGPAIALPTLADLRTWVSGVSPGGGLAAGTAHIRGLQSWRPVVWPTTESIMELPLLPNGSVGAAGDVNDVGQVAGSVTVSERRSASRVVPVVWTLP